MELKINYKTKVAGLIIEFIEIVNKNGKMFTLNWDKSDLTETEDGYSAYFSGIMDEDDYVEENLEQFEGMKVLAVGLYSDEPEPYDIEITEIQFRIANDLGQLQTLVFEDAYRTDNNIQDTISRNLLETFIDDWLKKYGYDLSEIFDDADDISGLEQVAFDMKADFEKSKLNPFTERERQQSAYGSAFDNLYDSLVEELILPLLLKDVGLQK